MDVLHSKCIIRDNFEIYIVIFCDVPCSSTNRVNILLAIFARVSSHVTGIRICNKILTAKRLQQSYQHHKFR